MKKTALRLSPKREQLLEEARARLLHQQQLLKSDFLAGGDAAGLLARYAGVIDALLALMYKASPGASDVAVLAVGGYGRRELYPYSDIDILFLYDKKNEKAAAATAEFILYLLWDLGLTVGQAHRTIDETLVLARDDTGIRTTLLDARLVVGERKIFDRFQSRFEKEIRQSDVLSFVEAKLAERDARHLRFGDSRYMLEPNLKEGKGGLRDVHTLWWLARYLYPIKTLKDMIALKLLTKEEYETFDDAIQFLACVRVHLHYLAGRAEERLSFDRQKALAYAMGYAHDSPNRSITRFMRRYFIAVRTVGSITRIFCALLEEEKKRKPRLSLAWLSTRKWKLGNFRLDGERLGVRTPHAFVRSPLLMLELFKVAQENDLDIHPKALQGIVRNLKRIDSHVQNDPKACAMFMDILLSPRDPEKALRRMSEAGVLGRFIPDFGRVVGQTQFNMYHVYTVDEHTLVALGMLAALEKGLMKDEFPLASDIIQRINMRRVLYLALFCHDIAKGRGGDHSQLGEKIAARLAARFGFSADEIETTAWLVRHHLLFSDTAMKRDINDPKTIADFAAKVKSPERLRLLLLLTVPDMRATNPTVWNAWKGSLFRELFARTQAALGEGESHVKAYQVGALKEELMALLPEFSHRDIDHYLEQGNPGFLTSCSVGQHAVIARMLKDSRPVMMEVAHNYARSLSDIVIATPDQHGLFSKLAGAMSLSGANIMSARIYTLKDGTAVDIFQVQNAAGEAFDKKDKLASMRQAIEEALSGRLDLAAEFLRKKSRPIRAGHVAVPIAGQVFVDNNASNLHTVIELSGQDRIGFLYQVTRAISELGLTIATAHISTYGAQASDVFYVKDIFGMKIGHENKIRQIREALLKTINN